MTLGRPGAVVTPAEGGWLPSLRSRVAASGWMAPFAAVALASYVAVATFPGLTRALGPGVDASWAYALNVLPHTDLLFGRDVISTYGPLGYLVVPTDVGSNLVYGAVARLVAQLALLGLVVGAYRNRRLVAQVAAFALVFLLAMSFPPSFDYRLLLVLGLILGVSPRAGPVWSVASIAAALLAAFLLFVKFSAGIAALAMVAVWSLVLIVTGRALLRRVLISVALPYGLGVVMLAALFLRSPASFGQWVEGSVEIVRGYPSAMAVPISSGLLWLGLLSLLAFVAGIVAVARADRSLIAASAALAVLVLIAFRHSYTRSGRDYFTILLASSAIIVLLARGRGAFRRGLVASLFLIPAFLLGVAGDPLLPVLGSLDPADGWRSLRGVFTLDEVRREVQATSEAELAVDRLSPDWVADIRASRGVDTVPAEIAFVAANDLPWIPNPILQTYAAYTPLLDLRAADHFRSEDGPEFVLAQFVNIDRRHPMLDVPATWRAIVGRYEMDRYADLAMLRRRETPLDLDLRVTARGQAEFGPWIDVPSTRGYLFLSARFHHNLGGRLAEAFWRLDPVFVDLRYADGRLVTWQFLPSTAENGLLMAPLPSCYAELVAMMENRPVSPVLQLRFHGPGTRFYEPQADLVWLEAPGADRPVGTSGGVC